MGILSELRKGDIVYFWIQNKNYVAIVLDVLNKDTGKAFLRIVNEGRGDSVTDFNIEADYNLEPKDLHWSFIR